MAETDPRLSAATIVPTVLARLVAVAEDRGYPTAPWFAGTGITARHLTSPGFLMSFRQVAAILRRALRALPAAAPWGMMTGARDLDVAFGLVGLAMKSCRTFGDAVMLGLELHQVGGSMLDYTVEYFDERVGVRFYERTPDPELLCFLCEEALTIAVMFCRAMARLDESPTEIQVRYPAPPYADEYRRLFRCPIRFESDVTRIIFAAHLLDHPLSTHNEASLAATLDACHRLLNGRDTAPRDIVAVVETLLTENLRHPLTMSQVATRLSLTERTLRRQLADAGARFNDLRDTVRRRRAAHLILETQMTIADIATELGFTDQREFRRAYLRWHGEPPTTTRRNRH
ncbi:AraC family transcriptional regulator [Nocardia sp. NPDC052566]|uniref:AraC family transcriptional regulator n=1 Tax=Nocardia sp. NPDC052566 TaxID=3364330 RepID=UPI0037CB36E3